MCEPDSSMSISSKGNQRLPSGCRNSSTTLSPDSITQEIQNARKSSSSRKNVINTHKQSKNEDFSVEGPSTELMKSPHSLLNSGKPKIISPYQRKSSNSNSKSLQVNENKCSIMEASSSSGSLSIVSSESPKMVCGVCGDRAKSFHFGGISCDSCKAFFRRAVQNEGYKNFRCSQSNDCPINMGTRKSCQRCRFEKCTSIGMEVKWVMSEEERIQHNLNRSRGRRSSNSTGSRISPRQHLMAVDEEDDIDLSLKPNEADMLIYMTPEEKAEIESITKKYHDSYIKIPYNVSQTSGNRNPVEIIKMFTTILRRFAFFCKNIDDYNKLSTNDQQNLLRAGVLEMCLLRGAFVFDMDNNRWPSSNIEFLKDCPRLRLEDMQKLVSSELYDMHMSFINSVQKLKADEPTVMLLLLVVLFYPERADVEDDVGINQSQEKFISLLHKYVKWRYGPINGAKLFPRLLTKLSDLRQLNDSHTEYNLKLAQQDLNVIQDQLGQINLNPYPQWDILEKGKRDAFENRHNSAISSGNEIVQEGSSSLSDGSYRMSHPLQPKYQQQQQQQHQTNPMSMANQAQKYFHHLITQKIPTLIQNPFAPISLESDILQARALFQSQGMNMEMLQRAAASGNLQPFPGYPMIPPTFQAVPTLSQESVSHAQSLMAHSFPQYSPSVSSSEVSPHLAPDSADEALNSPAMTSTMSLQHQPQIQQMKEMLESLGATSDPNFLAQLKNSLSSTALSNLGSVFGGSVPFDFNAIPPEMISSFLQSGGLGGTEELNPSTIQQQQQQHISPPFPMPQQNLNLNTRQWPQHPSTQQNPAEYNEYQQQVDINYDEFLPSNLAPFDPYDEDNGREFL